MGNNDPHAVRWATSKGLLDYNFTKWHWTNDCSKTLCGRRIRLANEKGTCLPETDDSQETVTCKYCKKKLKIPV
jgi:hypothetical protein